MALAMPDLDSVIVRHMTASMYDFCCDWDICRHSNLLGGFLHICGARGSLGMGSPGISGTPAANAARQDAASENRLV